MSVSDLPEYLGYSAGLEKMSAYSAAKETASHIHATMKIAMRIMPPIVNVQCPVFCVPCSDDNGSSVLFDMGNRLSVSAIGAPPHSEALERLVITRINSGVDSKPPTAQLRSADYRREIWQKLKTQISKVKSSTQKSKPKTASLLSFDLHFCLLPFAFCLLPFALCLLPFAFCLLPF